MLFLSEYACTPSVYITYINRTVASTYIMLHLLLSLAHLSISDYMLAAVDHVVVSYISVV